MVATQYIDTLGPIWIFSLRGVLTFVASGLDINGCVLSYFEGPNADPTIIRKLDPNPAGKTQTRLHPIGTYCTANAIKSINNLRGKNPLLTVSLLLDCDGYNSPWQKNSIHVRLFLSLPTERAFLIHSLLFQL